jgi:hypothetical protein
MIELSIVKGDDGGVPGVSKRQESCNKTHATRWPADVEAAIEKGDESMFFVRFTSIDSPYGVRVGIGSGVQGQTSIISALLLVGYPVGRCWKIMGHEWSKWITYREGWGEGVLIKRKYDVLWKGEHVSQPRVNYYQIGCYRLPSTAAMTTRSSAVSVAFVKLARGQWPGKRDQWDK